MQGSSSVSGRILNLPLPRSGKDRSGEASRVLRRVPAADTIP